VSEWKRERGDDFEGAVLTSIQAFISILAAVTVVMISLGTTRPGGVDVKLINDNAELAPAVVGVLNMMLAYGKFCLLLLYHSHQTSSSHLTSTL